MRVAERVVLEDLHGRRPVDVVDLAEQVFEQKPGRLRGQWVLSGQVAPVQAQSSLGRQQAGVARRGARPPGQRGVIQLNLLSRPSRQRLQELPDVAGQAGQPLTAGGGARLGAQPLHEQRRRDDGTRSPTRR